MALIRGRFGRHLGSCLDPIDPAEDHLPVVAVFQTPTLATISKQGLSVLGTRKLIFTVFSQKFSCLPQSLYKPSTLNMFLPGSEKLHLKLVALGQRLLTPSPNPLTSGSIVRASDSAVAGERAPI